jgi:flagellar hook-associated protein 3 FlgL
MKTSFISTSAISAASRLSLMQLQAKLASSQKEVTTGRFADVGLTLGYKTGQTVSLRQELARLQTITDTNAVATTRLDASQAALAGMVDNVQSFIGQLIGARNSISGPSIAEQQAKLGLGSFIDSLNTTVDGAFIFAGINADVKAVNAYYQSPISPAQQAVADAFQTQFGFPQSDPAAINITSVDMQTFLDTTFADLFDPAGWATNWSAASDDGKLGYQYAFDNMPLIKRRLVQAGVRVAGLLNSIFAQPGLTPTPSP